MKKFLSKKNLALSVSTVLILAIGMFIVFSRSDSGNQETGEVETIQENTIDESEIEIIKKAEVIAEPPVPALKQLPPAINWPVLLSFSEASSITVVVNKKHKLPENYSPGLRSEASNAMLQLTTAASNAGVDLKIISSYRSYATQVSTYNKWVNQSGRATADTFSARPGHSEHQTGLAIDVGASNGACDLETCFGNTPEGLWVAANAQNYGFIVRYQNGKDAITGYQYEPWHLRFVGVDVAKAITSSGLTMDQYYGIEGGGY